MVDLSADRAAPRPAEPAGQNSAVSTYIPEIDALRAFAVLGVMFYHLNPILLPGGFVGVDVFFVISGYVVTASLWRDIERPFGSMILQFYARRVLRIVPALLVCLVVTAAATILFIPDAWLNATTQRTGLFAFFGISNFALFSADSYFAPRTEFNSFAHTWTLGVEEQFYLLLPGIIYLFIRSRYLSGIPQLLCRFLLPTISIISVLIFALNSGGEQRSNFYLLPGRFWELGIGALLFQLQATGKIARLLPVAVQGLLVTGAASVVTAAVFSDRGAFPFPWAIPAALGSLFIIAVVTRQEPVPSPISAVLRNSVLISVGKISYSLYLWHWSTYTLFRWTVGLDGVAFPILALSLSFLFAVLSYIFVEEPIRHGRRILALPKLAVVLGGVAAIVLTWGAVREAFTERRSLSLSVVMRSSSDWYPWAWPGSSPDCEARSETEYIDGTRIESIRPSCVGKDVPLRQLFAVGDSHTYAYHPLLVHLASEERIQIFAYAYAGCPFADLSTPSSPSCEKFTATAIADIAKKGSRNDLVFLASLRMPYLRDEAGPHDKEELLAQQASAQAADRRRVAYQQAVELIGALKMLDMRVIFEAPPPIFRSPISQCSDWFNARNPICASGLSVERDELLEYRQPVMESIDALAKTYPDLVVWDPFPILCPEETCRALTDTGRPLFMDADHLSAFANTVLYPSFASLLHRVQDEIAPTPLTSGATSGQRLP